MHKFFMARLREIRLFSIVGSPYKDIGENGTVLSQWYIIFNILHWKLVSEKKIDI